jgi:cytochrome b pre-mRNA-processing protein 3
MSRIIKSCIADGVAVPRGKSSSASQVQAETNPMFFSRFRRSAGADTISTLYGMIVAQARLPVFYRDYAVADTVNGRFDLLVLHLSMVLGRLWQESEQESEQVPALKQLGQGVFDRFCEDMDANLREIGIADLKVPKEMTKMGQAYYGRAQAYQVALDAPGDQALAETIARNIYGGSPPVPAAAQRLAAYMRLAVGELRAQSAASLAEGNVRFPDPAAAT